jgi:hypothetical protein
MKYLLLCAAFMVSSAKIHSQGMVNFATRIPGSGIDARFSDGCGPALSPPWLAALAVQSGAGFLTIPNSTTTFRSGFAAGYVNPIVVVVPGVPIGAKATLVMVTFQGLSFETAAVKSISNAVTVTLGGDVTLPPDLVGLQAFTILDPCPEPSTITLLAAAALVLSRRKLRNIQQKPT